MINQNQLIQHGHPSEVKYFQALGLDKLYLHKASKRITIYQLTEVPESFSQFSAEQ